MATKRVYTENQTRFLEAFEDDPSDIRGAMSKAGYSETVSKKEVTDSLAEEMVSIASKILAKTAAKAATRVSAVLDDGSIAGASNVLKAAQIILDRAGVVTKSEDLTLRVPSGGLVIMPAKDVPKSDYTENRDE